jgi:hypothetical protein
MTRLMVAMALLVVACGGGDSMNVEEYGQEFRDAFCKNFVKCGVVKDLETCRKLNFSPELDLSLHLSATAKAAFDSGKARFNSDNAQACVDGLADFSCDVADESQRLVPEACDSFASGTLHAGEACTVGVECISLFCAVEQCNMACCPGTCLGETPPGIAKVGESCRRNRCVSGSYCNMDNGICTPVKPLNAECVEQNECESGLACIPPFVGGNCIKLPKLGEACTNFCTEFGALCDPTSKICVKGVLGGEACLGDFTGSNCSPLYACDAGRCSGGLALGATCTPDDRCADHFAFCDVPVAAPTGICVLPKANGTHCEFNRDCQSFRCDDATLLCVDEPVCM